MLPGRRWADSQLAKQQGRRLPFSVEPGGDLPPALPMASTTTIVLFYMRLSPTPEQGLFSFQNATLPHSSALHVVSVIIRSYHQHCECGKAPT